MKVIKSISNSIRNKSIAVVIIPLLLVFTFITIYYPGKQEESSMNSVKTQVKTLSEMLAFSVGAGLNDGNFDLVQTTFDWAKKDSNVVYIKILDETGEGLIEYNPESFEVDGASVSELKLDEEKEVLERGVPIEYSGKNFGKIVLLYSLKSTYDYISSARNTSLIALTLIVLLSIVFSSFVFSKISKNVVELRDAATKASEGDLSVKIEKSSNDEIGDLTLAFNKMLDNINHANHQLELEKESVEKKVDEAVLASNEEKKYLEESVNEILTAMNKFAGGDLTVELRARKDDAIGQLFNGFNDSVKNIKEMMLQISEAIQATVTATSDISSSTEQMASGSQEQSSQASEVASAIEEMAATIMESTQNANSAAENANNAVNIAQEGGNVVKSTVNGMNRISEVVSQAASLVRELGKNSDQIGEIIQVIDDIADQTNLLALNAAIEAARAGEQGRGFAVVADEVRKLAERTTKATKEIADMIKKIQGDTGNAVRSIESGTEEVEKGKELASKSGVSLEQIIQGANETVGVVKQVAAASDQQSQAIEQISISVEGINNVSHESASGLQEIARAAEDLNNLTANLQNLISGFTLGNNNSYSADYKGSQSKKETVLN